MAAGSDAARNVAEIVLIDNDFAAMPAVVAEGRRSINNLQRSAALFLSKTLFSMGLAALCIAFPPYPFEPITMTLINFFCIGFPSFVLALEPNRARVQGSFLANVLKRALPASLAVIAACAASMAASSLLGLPSDVLSTLCLGVTCAVGVSLIWEISRPFTPLRIAVLVFVICGIVLQILLLPGFFSIAPIGLGSGALLLLIGGFGVVSFRWLDAALVKVGSRRARSASGLGRGVRVSIGRGGGRVSATVSAPRRAVERIHARADERADERALHRAAADAARAVEGDRSGSRSRRLTKSASGIRMKMDSRRHGSRRTGADKR